LQWNVLIASHEEFNHYGQCYHLTSDHQHVLQLMVRHIATPQLPL